VSAIEFTEPGPCERCGGDRLVCRTGVCDRCFEEMRKLGSDDLSRAVRLKQLSTSEGGIVQSIRHRMLLETRQQSPDDKHSFSRMFKQRDQHREQRILSRKRLETIFKASPQQLTRVRQDGVLDVQLTAVNAELVRWLSKHPEQMRELSPRKFEEVVAEIIRDQGHQVQLTPATRDGGRDIIVEMKTALGSLLVIVECKRWLPPNKVGLAVVERFLHVIREKSKANLGIIAATTSFSLDARKTAREYEYQLRLADFEQLREMAQRFGTWHQNSGCDLWVPDYTKL